MIFWDFKFLSDCCGERKGDATSFLLRFVSFVNYVLTLFMCENCTAIGSGDMYNINECNSSYIKKLFPALRYYRLSLLRTLNRVPRVSAIKGVDCTIRKCALVSNVASCVIKFLRFNQLFGVQRHEDVSYKVRVTQLSVLTYTVIYYLYNVKPSAVENRFL